MAESKEDGNIEFKSALDEGSDAYPVDADTHQG